MKNDGPRGSSSTRPVCIHIGTPKTATTMLQQQLFARHPQVSFLGKFRNSLKAGFPDPSVRAVVSWLMGRADGCDPGDIDAVKRLAADAKRDNKSLVVSCENFAAGTDERNRGRAENFKEIFCDAKILLVVREPFAYLESRYFQHLREYNLKNAAYNSLRGSFPEPPHYFSIDQWLEVVWKRSISGSLHYADKANQYAEVFGRDRVKVMSFDGLKADFRGFVNELSEWMHLDPEVSYELCAGKRSNDRWTEQTIEQLKEMSESSGSRWNFRLFSRGGKRNYELKHKDDAAGDSPKARAEMSPHWRRIVERAAEKQCRKLEAEWGITFERRNRATASPRRRAA